MAPYHGPVIECTSWDHFKNVIVQHPFGAADHEWIYRGHADLSTSGEPQRWRLQSVWERRQESDATRLHHEVGLLQIEGRHFYRAVPLDARLSDFIHRLGQTEDSDTRVTLAALGRHYGLLTDLLDWTLDPLRAAFFAYERYVAGRTPGITDGGDWLINAPSEISEVEYMRSRYTSPVCVWALRNPTRLHSTSPIRTWDQVNREPEGGLSVAPPSLPEFGYFRGPWPTDDPMYERIRQQQGVFTRLESQRIYDLESYLVRQRQIDHLIAIKLPGNAAIDALPDLHEQGINYATLFPGPDGAARQANLRAWFCA